ncbi:uncharacterized protein PHALS_01856 [Plasmopara halstedii]|uniref:Uncharacterized protein n=1 Tax=Plasmopara halstedii TaxID=4781 RepID=A0A0P1ATE6_PLAHL|nr:uncharacterized protein PHALS_01856 [Plasmopara halstedii]CEG45569.1 hypothetical protein PHALS_01856 [Plasmopara halstedii]|eukprot:XP_024581938.1 hypothetical protein PHALS_01856 [Plasmopara halstedii]
MTRRGPKTSTQVHRDTKATSANSEVMPHRHHILRRSSGFMLARKYRNPWPTENDFGREYSSHFMTGNERSSSAAQNISSGSTSSTNSVPGVTGSKSYTREELINFWRELALVTKRRLLRIRRESYLTALDQFLVGQNLCCECHDNVVAEWEDHERKRSGSRSLQDVFSVFPPFLNDEENDDDDDDEGDDEADLGDESEEEDMVLEEELVFKYELEREERHGTTGKSSMVSDEYLAALEVGKRQEDELMRLIQREERFIIIREDHTDFIIDLIRCGEQFSYVSPYRSGFDDEDSINSDDNDDVDDTCPGANTPHLAQEYLLEVLAIKFREQLEDAYQEALQHSLAVQAELLRDELADLNASQKSSSTSRKKKGKKEKKRRKKEAAISKAVEKENPRETTSQSQISVSPTYKSLAKQQPSLILTDETCDYDTEVRCPEEDEIDREVEQFRLLLEKINSESVLRSRKKLVLPPGSFAHLNSMNVV